jgi:hypothetical protein
MGYRIINTIEVYLQSTKFKFKNHKLQEHKKSMREGEERTRGLATKKEG